MADYRESGPRYARQESRLIYRLDFSVEQILLIFLRYNFPQLILFKKCNDDKNSWKDTGNGKHSTGSGFSEHAGLEIFMVWFMFCKDRKASWAG